MRKYIFFIIALIAAGNVYSQTDSVFISIANLKYNILYFGVENPVSIGISNVCNQKPEVGISCGTIKYKGNGEYSVWLDTLCGKESTIITTIIKEDGTMVSYGFEFRNKTVPDPIIKIANKKNGETINKNVLLSQTEISAVLDDFDYDVCFKVLSFSISSDETTHKLYSNDNEFSNLQMDLIRNTEIGKPIYFKDIKVQCTDKIVRKVEDCVWILK